MSATIYMIYPIACEMNWQYTTRYWLGEPYEQIASAAAIFAAISAHQVLRLLALRLKAPFLAAQFQLLSIGCAIITADTVGSQPGLSGPVQVLEKSPSPVFGWPFAYWEFYRYGFKNISLAGWAVVAIAVWAFCAILTFAIRLRLARSAVIRHDRTQQAAPADFH